MTALELLKVDLHLSTDSLDEYLTDLIDGVILRLQTEGLEVDLDDADIRRIVVQYASFLYRSRRLAGALGDSNNGKMPRYLRWAINNALMSQKGASDDDG